MLESGSLVMYQFVCICQRGKGWAYEEVLTTYKPYSAMIFDANDADRELAEHLKNLPKSAKGRRRKADRYLG